MDREKGLDPLEDVFAPAALCPVDLLVFLEQLLHGLVVLLQEGRRLPDVHFRVRHDEPPWFPQPEFGPTPGGARPGERVTRRRRRPNGRIAPRGRGSPW